MVGRLNLRVPIGGVCSPGGPYLTSTIIDFKNFYSKIIISRSNLIFAGRRYNFDDVRRRSSIRRSCLGSNFCTHDLRRRLPGPRLCIHFLLHARSIAGHMLSTTQRTGARARHHITISSVVGMVDVRISRGSSALANVMSTCCTKGRF